MLVNDRNVGMDTGVHSRTHVVVYLRILGSRAVRYHSIPVPSAIRRDARVTRGLTFQTLASRALWLRYLPRYLPPDRIFPISTVVASEGGHQAGKTYIVSALFVLKLSKGNFPAKGPTLSAYIPSSSRNNAPRAFSNGVVVGHLASPSSLTLASERSTTSMRYKRYCQEQCTHFR
jgi:hypothetical protein